MLKAAHAVVLQLINQRLVRYITHIYPTIFKHSFQSNYEIIPSDRSMTNPAKQNMRCCLDFFVCIFRGFKLTPINCTVAVNRLTHDRMLDNVSSCFAAY